MKAAVLTGYDKNGRDLEIRDIPVPVPGAALAHVQLKSAGPIPSRWDAAVLTLQMPWGFVG